MSSVAVNNGFISGKKKRMNFLVPEPLAVKIILLAKENQLTTSDFFRQKMERCVEEEEAKKLESELEEGYKSNVKYYSKLNKEWEGADIE